MNNQINTSLKDTATRRNLPEHFSAWLKSDSGRDALTAALLDCNNTIGELNEARKVKPEQLHIPITL